jgi:hypothetical protein
VAAKAWAAQTQILTRADASARSEAALLAEAADPSPVPPAVRPDHILEVRLRIDDCERTFRAVCLRGEWIGDSGNLITTAIRLVMAAGRRA